jgi:hypothetical protein
VFAKNTHPMGLVNCRRIAVRERLLRFLLGDKRRLTVIVPGDSVKTLSIIEEGGITDEQDDAAR